MLQIGGVPEKEKDQVYVRFAPRNAVYTLPKKIEEVLENETVRFTRPTSGADRHGSSRPHHDRAPGKGKTVLARKDESWTIASRNNQPANAGEVTPAARSAQSEQVTKFVEDVASDLPKYGLDKPQLQLTFSSFASENTAETQAGEHPFATIAFGKIDGDNVYARLGESHSSSRCGAPCSITFLPIPCNGRSSRSSSSSQNKSTGCRLIPIMNKV